MKWVERPDGASGGVPSCLLLATFLPDREKYLREEGGRSRLLWGEGMPFMKKGKEVYLASQSRGNRLVRITVEAQGQFRG